MNYDQELRVGIQGIVASFHHEAAKRFFHDRKIAPIPFSSFPLLCRGLKEGKTHVALMAIENSIAGSILPNYSLLESHSFQILGEISLRIKLNVMALPGQKLEDIQFAKSHPIALLQCQEFLMSCPWIKVLEGTDTAASAKEIQDSGKLGYAAIAGQLAAEAYGLEILRSRIESNSQNYTRFLVICRKEDYLPLETRIPTGTDQASFKTQVKTQAETSFKASLRFEVPNQAGSLVEVLSVFREYQINMTHLQSVVIPGKPNQYSFHIDLEWQDPHSYQLAIDKLKEKTLRLIHFGIYPKGEQVEL